ncbi:MULTISPECIES: alpha/beta fold hydrolase [Mycolicibacterium]|jgi:pimeloyl-ACP methyl ester carboxylesterase|uniref:Alpha/beta hydrolase fold protein n=2 Tax=Mycolicibacterium TaxID=1866885 RepID=A1T385_MYCVP|nr:MULTISPECIES: alpha/beta hydrolase [Mycolicibacterium]ABM11635.1 alpha/beta hydrolase fold protein [Mycolicibacterium vanbaalenii PYR-1]MCV7126289.1 alpha/beta hydrolase [Mycolicibacterium vanbaalenii PYR-1]MDN4517529.1 alpha/beta hydrolase [Mycolicibacterium austroafricanum]MDW5613001.1 alpha/beta hydrolase [Mycolicibacterium sp. D5.8-2]PQP48120.1 alpha/beta hydrolase [Mycolicibacterium austroafricanum]
MLSNPWRHPPGVPRCEPPRAEGAFFLPDGRRIGYAEYGDPSGPVVLWFHGTPGGRRQLPIVGRRAAEKLGLRVVLVERAGSGLSHRHCYDRVGDWATDMAHVADLLGAEKLGVVGLSGGGPFALACAGMPALADRVVAVAVLGGVTPSVGPDAACSGAITLSRKFAPVTSAMRRPFAAVTAGLLTPVIPLAHLAYRGLSAAMPEGDKRVFANPEIEAMFIDDIVHAANGGFQALLDDARLFGRDWGFRLADVKVPVRWWHGDADSIISLADAQAATEHLPDVELLLMPDESHLGGFAKADDVLDFLHQHLLSGHRP